MRELQALIQDLESPDSSIRDKAALDLMDIQDAIAVEPLLRAIAKPENVNHRGTLVYALREFNCEAILPELVELALTGNYEVCAGACSIIEESITSAETANLVQAQLKNFVSSTQLAEHNQIALQDLLELTSSNGWPAT